MSLKMYINFSIDIFRLLVFTIWILLQRFRFIFTQQELKKLTGEVVLVTGGANGIGRAICHELVLREKDLIVIIWDIDESAMEAVVQELESLGVKKVVGFKIDVGDRFQIENGAKQIQSQFGDVTMLFNNAGISGQVGLGWTLFPESVQKVFEVNLLSHCWTMREFLPSMIRKGRGHIIEICSVVGLLHAEAGSPYIASKHGMLGFAECVKEDIRKLPGNRASHSQSQVYFSIAFPNYTKTAFMDQFNFKSKYPFLFTIWSPQEVANRLLDKVLVNEEHIYFPGSFRFLPTILGLLPASSFRRFTDMLAIEYK